MKSSSTGFWQSKGVATIDVKEQKMKLFLDKKQVEEFDYKLR